MAVSGVSGRLCPTLLLSRFGACKVFPVRVVASRTWKAVNADRLFGHAAELGFYFLFALFPTLFCASSILVWRLDRRTSFTTGCWIIWRS